VILTCDCFHCHQASVEICSGIQNAVADVLDSHRQWSAASLQSEAKLAEKEQIEFLIRDAEEEEKSGKSRVDKAKEEEARWRETARALKSAAEKLHPLTDEIKIKWASVSDSSDELEVQITELQFQVSSGVFFEEKKRREYLKLMGHVLVGGRYSSGFIHH